MVKIAHLTDLHLSNPRLTNLLRETTPKRWLGYISWHLRRRRRFDHRRLEVLAAQLQALAVDHMLITGDFTQLGLAEEFEEVRFWLKRFEAIAPTTVLPGNHDLYAPSSWNHLPSWCPTPFPVTSRMGEVALIGLNSALPLPFPYAAGEIDAGQLAFLARWLKEHRHRFRIVALHHPPYEGAVPSRKALWKADGLLAILKEHGCELILHGHSHRWQLHWLFGEIPTLGLSPALYRSRELSTLGRFQMIEISSRELWTVYVYSWQKGRFQLETRLRFQSQPTTSNNAVGRIATSQAGRS